MAKAKVWYKHLKIGDRVLVKLLPGHAWFDKDKNNLYKASIKNIYGNGTISLDAEKSLSDYCLAALILLGLEGTDWEKEYPATIIRKLKKGE